MSLAIELVRDDELYTRVSIYNWHKLIHRQFILVNDYFLLIDWYFYLFKNISMKLQWSHFSICHYILDTISDHTVLRHLKKFVENNKYCSY